MQQATPPIEVHTIAGCIFELPAPVIKALKLHKGLEIGCIPLSFKDPDQPNFRLGIPPLAFDAIQTQAIAQSCRHLNNPTNVLLLRKKHTVIQPVYAAMWHSRKWLI